MKKFKIFSTITDKINKIGILTNRNNKKENKNELITIKNIQDIENIIQKINLIFDEKKLQNNTERYSNNIERLENYLSIIEKSILDFNNFNTHLFKSLLESNLISILTENINIYSNKISNIIIIFLQKIIFLDEIFIQDKKLKEEQILIDTKIVSAIKKIIFEFDNILKKVNIININSDLFNLINTGILPFLNDLFQKIIKFPNLYYALLNNSATININLELQLFDILFILFKFEYQIKDRTSRAYIRKNLLRFINNFNFQNRKELLKKLINQVILNLIEYYQNFLLLSIKDINDNYKILNNFPLNLSENDIMELISDDTLSYLEFFNIIINNFLEKDLKIYLIDLLYNNFLCKYILEEIINLANDISYKARSTLLIEYIYFLSLCIHNYDINILFFYFFFGFNFESDQENNINNINFRKIISKSNNNYEAIRAYFTLIFDSNNTNLLILLMKTLTNFVKRIPYLFISEMVSPFYLFYLNKNKISENNFEDVLDNLTKNSEKTQLTDLIFYFFMEIYYLFILICSIIAIDNIRTNKINDSYKFNKLAITFIIILTFIIGILPMLIKITNIFDNIIPMLLYLLMGASPTSSSFYMAKILNSCDTCGGNNIKQRKGIVIIMYCLINLFFGSLIFFNYNRTRRVKTIMGLAIFYLIYLFFKILAIVINLLFNKKQSLNNENINNEIKNEFNMKNYYLKNSSYNPYKLDKLDSTRNGYQSTNYENP